MPFDFSLSPRVAQWRDRIAEFVAGVVIPREQEAFADGLDDELRRFRAETRLTSAAHCRSYARRRARLRHRQGPAASGVGREWGHHGIEDFTELKSIAWG
jgi:hypothetical protein